VKISFPFDPSQEGERRGERRKRYLEAMVSQAGNQQRVRFRSCTLDEIEVQSLTIYELDRHTRSMVSAVLDDNVRLVRIFNAVSFSIENRVCLGQA